MLKSHMGLTPRCELSIQQEELVALLKKYVDDTGRHVQYGPMRRQRGMQEWAAAANLLPHLDMSQVRIHFLA